MIASDSSGISQLRKTSTRTRHSEPISGPCEGYCESRAISHDEPTNEELGIVPYRGWRLLLVWLAPYALIALAFGAYVVIAQGMGWWR